MDETIKKYRLRHPRCRYCTYLITKEHDKYISYICQVRSEEMARQMKSAIAPDYDHTMKSRLFCSGFKLKE